MSIFDYIKQKMSEAGIENFQINTVLTDVSPGSRRRVGDSEEYIFTANAFSEGTVKGSISATNQTFNLNSAIVKSDFAIMRAFKGVTIIENKGNDTLYVEFVKVIPVTGVSEAQVSI